MIVDDCEWKAINLKRNVDMMVVDSVIEYDNKESFEDNIT